MAVELVCSCGRQLRITEAHAGRQVKCPGCGASHTVRDNAITSQPSRAPSFAQASPARGKTTAIVLLLLLLISSVVTWWLFFRNPGRDATDVYDLSLIPATAQGFASLRLGDAWQTPAAHKAIEAERDRNPEKPGFAARMEGDLGLRPEQIERLSLVVMEFTSDPQKAAEKSWAIFRTYEPYNQNKVLEQWQGGQRRIKYEGKAYHVGEHRDGRRLAMHFAGSHVLVIGNEEGVKRCLDHRANPYREGPLSPLIVRGEGRHHVVGGFSLPDDVRAQLREGPLVGSLAEVQWASATLDLPDESGKEEALLEVRGLLGSEEEARKMQKALAPMIALAPLMLPLMSNKVPGMPGRMIGRMAPVIGKMKMQQQGKEVVGTIRTDAVEMMQGVLEVVAQPPQ